MGVMMKLKGLKKLEQGKWEYRKRVPASAQKALGKTEQKEVIEARSDKDLMRKYAVVVANIDAEIAAAKAPRAKATPRLEWQAALTAPDELPDDVAELKAIIRAQQDQNTRFEALVASFKKALFGAKSEKIDPAQYELELEDIETSIAQVEAEIDADARTAPVRLQKPRQTNRGSLPKRLERVEVVIEPERSCACGAERHVIGEDVSERLDIIPAQFRVIVTRRPRYACRSCEGRIVQAPAPAHIIAGGMPTEATLARVLVFKYADHLPLYR